MGIDISELTIGQLREIQGMCGNRKPAESLPTKRGDYVVVRAYSGVFYGQLLAKRGAEVDLGSCRQIWSWGSAGCAQKIQRVGDIAARGLGTDSKVSDPVERATLFQVGALFIASSACINIMAAQKWGSR